MLNSLIAASVKFAFKLNIGCPKNFEPGKDVVDWVKNNKKIYVYNDPESRSKRRCNFFRQVISLNDKVNVKKKLNILRNLKLIKN